VDVVAMAGEAAGVAGVLTERLWQPAASVERSRGSIGLRRAGLERKECILIV
jgi:hypothetical protein